jgi:hypothetical protein
MSSANRFKPYAPDAQAVVRLEEALPPEHPVHVFVDLVRSVDLSHFVIPPGPKGEKPYHPHALFGILAWGYLHGVRSARKLARLARQEATFVYLAGGGRPNYRQPARCVSSCDSRTPGGGTPDGKPSSSRSSASSRTRAASPPSACAASRVPPASICWLASPTTSASCSGSARCRPPRWHQQRADPHPTAPLTASAVDHHLGPTPSSPLLADP